MQRNTFHPSLSVGFRFGRPSAKVKLIFFLPPPSVAWVVFQIELDPSLPIEKFTNVLVLTWSREESGGGPDGIQSFPVYDPLEDAGLASEHCLKVSQSVCVKSSA